MTQPHKETVLDALIGAIARAADYNQDDLCEPAVVLWPDKDEQWLAIVPRLREAMPHLLTLGAYGDSSNRTGPAIWLRCMLERKLPSASWPADVVPVVYLPGVSRQELRAVNECPWSLQPLVELQFRGAFFSQANGKDWSVAAFLASPHGGLGLDVATDRETLDAMRQALQMLADAPVEMLRSGRLEAADFQGLMTPDVDRTLLRWINDSEGTRKRWSADEWDLFRGQCESRYGFDANEGAVAAAGRLGSQDGAWSPAFRRFSEAPHLYPNLPELLRRAKPTVEDLFFVKSSWPQTNEAAEAGLRSALLALEKSAPVGAAGKILALESSHGERRGWVWARLGQSPLATALEHLAGLAHAVTASTGGESLNALAESWVADGWAADAAALEAMAAVEKTADVDAVKSAVRILYMPWLREGAERFQELVAQQTLPTAANASHLPLAPIGCCVLFADGLRFDVGERLKADLERTGAVVERGWRWVALPGVTPTAKPAVSPIADLLVGGELGESFTPSIRAGGAVLTIARFRQLLEERGFQVLRAEETGDPSGRAWAEYGAIDQYGHAQGWKLSRRIAEEVRGLAGRVSALLEAGWREVRVVTDHGWLLLPGGLPKVEMPVFLTDSRWTRCACLKSGANPEGPTIRWYWNDDVRLAVPHGIGSFKAGVEYSHGGLSLQECVAPTLTVRAKAAASEGASIESIKWVGLRCRIVVKGAEPGWGVDLRTKAGDPASSLAAGGKQLAADGSASLVVADDTHHGATVSVVVHDGAGAVVRKQPTTVGGE